MEIVNKINSVFNQPQWAYGGQTTLQNAADCTQYFIKIVLVFF